MIARFRLGWRQHCLEAWLYDFLPSVLIHAKWPGMQHTIICPKGNKLAQECHIRSTNGYLRSNCEPCDEDESENVVSQIR